MSIEAQMSIDERRKYLHKMRIRYWQAQKRTERSKESAAVGPRRVGTPATP